MLQRIAKLLRIQPPVIDNRGLLWASGATVPTLGSDGYQTGCIFAHTDGGDGTSLYVNEGSVTSCDFTAVDTAPGEDAGQIIFSTTATAPLIDINGSYDDQFIETGTYSSEADNGIVLSSTNTRPVSFLFDDSGSDLTGGNYRAVLSRILLTVDQSACTINAIRGQLKMLDLVDVATGIYAPVQGYLEMAGTHVIKADATFSCFSASMEIGTSMTVNNDGEAAGIHVETTGAGTITNNGTCAGILIDKATGAADWPVGVRVLNSTTGLSVHSSTVGLNFTGVTSTCIYVTGVGTTTSHVIDVVDAYAGKVIETGSYSSSASKGVTLVAANNRPVSFLFDDAGSALAGGDYRAVLSRIYLSVDHTNAATLNAMRAQIVVADDKDISNAGSVTSPFTAYFELAGTANRNVDGHVACMRAALEEGASGTTTIDINLCGVEATLNSTRTYAGSGYLAAYAANISGGTSLWQYGVYLESDAILTAGIYLGSTAAGILAAGTIPTVLSVQHVGTTSSHVIDMIDAYTGMVIETGSFSSSASKGITLSASNTRPVSILCDDGGAAMTGNIRGLLSRTVVAANHTGALSLASITGQAKLVGDVDFDGDYLCGLHGYLEIAGTSNFGLNEVRHAGCAVRARVEVAGSIEVETAGTYLAGVFAELNTTGAYTVTETGVLAAFVAASTDQRNDLWGSALYIDGADNALGFNAADASYTNGIKAVTKTPTGNTSHSIRVDIGGTPGYIPVYDDEAFNADD